MPGAPARLVHAACLAVLGVALMTACTPTPGPEQPKTCATTKDCPTGQLCKQLACVTLPCGGRCNNDEVCQNNVCNSADGLACIDDPSVCPTGFICSPLGTCARGCSGDTDCTQPGFRSCNTDAGFCGQCTFNHDCTAAGKSVCDPTTAACVGCIADKDCRAATQGVGAGLYCDSGSKTCKNGCHTVDDCQPGLRCDGASGSAAGHCIECKPATEVSDCLIPRIRCEPNQLVCVDCLGDSDCASAQCNTARHACVECVKNEVCAKGYVCDTNSTNTCVIGCVGGVGSANCPSTLPVCDGARGDRGTCVECLKDADCGRAKVCDLHGKTVVDDSGHPVIDPGTNLPLKVPACLAGCVDTTTGLPSDGRCQDATVTPAPTDVLCDGTKGGAHGKCVQCRTGNDCSIDKACDADTGQCRCKKEGETCGASSECGYKVINNVGTCSATRALCVTQISCTGNGLHSVAPVCTIAGSGLPGSSTSCPSGFINEDGYDAANQHGRQCVPSSYTCP